jgi:NTE family protein
MKINQIHGTNFGYLRFDYRFEVSNNIFFKLIVNVGVYDLVEIVNAENNFYGYGFGVKINSVLGPFELLFSRGSKSVFIQKEFKNVIYFTAGFIF